MIMTLFFARTRLISIMQTQRSSSVLLLTAGLLTSALLPSCSLPPGYAWRQIQRDGLIPFIQNGMSAPKAQTEPMLASGSAANRVIDPAKPTLNAPVASTPAQKAPFPAAYAVKDLNGYVRTPFTNPPRLVDVRGMNPGAKVVCPYTQRAFVVPAAAFQIAPVKTAPQMLAKTQPKLKSTPAPAPATKPTPAPAIARIDPIPATPKVAAAPAPTPKPIPSSPKVAAAPKPEAKAAPTPAPVTKPQPVETPKVAATTPPPSKPAPAPVKTQPAPPPVAATPAKLPFGSPITGRPGFVNSPYAEKHQLVDVTGLSVGTEVKCPYTGKLFRVPPQQQAKK
jgi:uncharacterized Zn-finger protein